MIKIRENFYKTNSAFLVGRKFPYGESFRQFFAKLWSSGIFKKIHSIYFEPKNTFMNMESDVNSVIEISLSHTYIIFVMYFLGLITACFGLIVEIIASKFF